MTTKNDHRYDYSNLYYWEWDEVDAGNAYLDEFLNKTKLENKDGNTKKDSAESSTRAGHTGEGANHRGV